MNQDPVATATDADRARDDSLLAQGQEELTGGFHPLRLWRDRRRILRDPVAAARPRPPLANGPLRFALALTLTPMLIVAWLGLAVVEVLPSESTPGATSMTRSAAVIAALEPQLPGLDRDALQRLAKFSPYTEQRPQMQALFDEADDYVFYDSLMAAPERVAKLDAWVKRVRASRLSLAAQNSLIARLLHSAHRMERGDRLMARFQKDTMEGGPIMQGLTAVALILGAWLFGQTIRGDTRFLHAARADAFYLYYTSSRIFWFIPAQALAYGVLSFASASDRASLLHSAQLASFAISAASFVWLLLGSGTMARALADGASPRGGAWAVAWRMTVSTVVAYVSLMVAAMAIVVPVAIAMAMWP